MAGVWGNVMAGNMVLKKKNVTSKLTSAVTFIEGT